MAANVNCQQTLVILNNSLLLNETVEKPHKITYNIEL